MMFFNPSFALCHKDVLFSLAPRITTTTDGRRLRLALDFFADKMKSSWATLEHPIPGSGGYTANDGGGRTFCWTTAQYEVRKYMKSRDFTTLSPMMETAAMRLTNELYDCLGVHIEASRLKRRIANAIAYDHASVPVLRRWLKHLGTRCVVESVHYCARNFALTRAAHELGIPVVELQHGTIYPAHAAYNLPVADSPYSPDYLLGWGGYWLRQTRNFPARKALAVGYPFLERALADHPRAPHGGTPLVLFISQGTIGKDLSALAVELGRKAGNAYRIVFKPHPNEVKSWRRLYPDLVDSGVEVAEDATRGIYSWLAEADAVAGVYSTAMIEGLVWGVKAYVFSRLPGAETMAGFCSCGAAEYVDGTEALDARLRALFASGAAGGAAIDRADFFVDNAAANVSAAIDRIVEGKEP